MNELLEKEKCSIKLLKSLCRDEEVELAYSGGKDSDVILSLCKEAGIKFRPIYKSTTIDPPGTIAHALENGCEVRRPATTFFELMKKRGAPSRFLRFCCSELKEYKILDTCVLGIRTQESRKRAKIYVEPEMCRFYSKKEYVRQIFPILYWTNEDVAEYVNSNGIKCHSLYYDENGVFHPERRLGCLGCPIASRRKRIENFRQYPKLMRQWCRSIRAWMDTPREKPLKLKEYFKDEYEVMYKNLLCDSIADFNEKTKGLFPFDCKNALEELIGEELR